MSLIDSLKDFFSGNPLVATSKERLSGVITGPLLISTIVVFWEIPLFLFSKNAEDKIRNVKSLIQGIEPHEVVVRPSNLMYRVLVIFFSWLIWVYAVPVILPFLINYREKIKAKSENINSFDGYFELKNEISNLKKDLVEEKKLSGSLHSSISGLKSTLNVDSEDFYKIIFSMSKQSLHIEEPVRKSDYLKQRLTKIFAEGKSNDFSTVIKDEPKNFSIEEILLIASPLVNKIALSNTKIQQLEKMLKNNSQV